MIWSGGHVAAGIATTVIGITNFRQSRRHLVILGLEIRTGLLAFCQRRSVDSKHVEIDSNLVPLRAVVLSVELHLSLLWHSVGVPLLFPGYRATVEIVVWLYDILLGVENFAGLA